MKYSTRRRGQSRCQRFIGNRIDYKLWENWMFVELTSAGSFETRTKVSCRTDASVMSGSDAASASRETVAATLIVFDLTDAAA